MTSGQTLRELIEDGLVHAPGCHDALGAALIERAGFAAAYLSGFALSASSMAAPDLGLVGLDDIVGAVQRIASNVGLPIIEGRLRAAKVGANLHS